MSYCRIGNDSDIYVYGDVVSRHIICATHFPEFKTGSYQEMIKHLREHTQKGDRVPERAFMLLESERAFFGDIYLLFDD